MKSVWGLDRVVRYGAVRLDHGGHGFVLSQEYPFGLLCVILLFSTATVPNRAGEASENAPMNICEKFPGTQKQKQIKTFDREWGRIGGLQEGELLQVLCQQVEAGASAT